MEQAIKDAKGAGWNDKHAYFYCPLSGDEQDHALIDPSFWKALGKARGWYSEKPQYQINNQPAQWAYHWHRLIDALAAGKDINSFFEDLK